MNRFFEFIPKLSVVAGLLVSIAMIIHGFYPILPWQWVGWGKRNRRRRLNVKDWQGREFYLLHDAAALWEELPPERPDDRTGSINFRRAVLDSAVRRGEIECSERDINRRTPVSAGALRKYAAKQGQMPEFLK